MDRHPLDVDASELGGMVINPASELGKELRKWEQFSHKYGPPGNPYVFRAYPKMLYKAQPHPRQIGRRIVMMQAPHPFEYPTPEEFNRAALLKEEFDRSCQKIVANESEEAIANGQGWRATIGEALELMEAEAKAIGTAAAELEYAAQRMSEQAKAEIRAAHESTHQHVTDVRGVPKSRRGRPRKVKTEAVVADPAQE